MRVASEAATAHRDLVANALMDELRRQGFQCRADHVMGAFYINLWQNDGFTLEVGREWVKSDRPAPFEHDYTGKAKVEYQGFGQSKGFNLVEPEGGFDLVSVVKMLGREIRESTARRTGFLARKAEVERQAEAIVERLDAEFGVGTLEGVAELVNGEWEPLFSVEATGLTEERARRVLAVLAAEGKADGS